MAPIVYTYIVDQTALYRTTANLTVGAADGSGDRHAAAWQPSTIWQGVSANSPVTANLKTTQGSIAAFTVSGDIGFTADGFVTLV